VRECLQKKGLFSDGTFAVVGEIHHGTYTSTFSQCRLRTLLVAYVNKQSATGHVGGGGQRTRACGVSLSERLALELRLRLRLRLRSRLRRSCAVRAAFCVLQPGKAGNRWLYKVALKIIKRWRSSEDDRRRPRRHQHISGVCSSEDGVRTSTDVFGVRRSVCTRAVGYLLLQLVDLYNEQHSQGRTFTGTDSAVQWELLQTAQGEESHDGQQANAN
jgi:hypothetical protein